MSISSRMAMDCPVPVEPMIASTSSCSMSFVVAAIACRRRCASSSMSTSSGCPLMPPASLIRATSISMAFFSGVPSPACAPVSDSTAPIVSGSFVTSSASPASTLVLRCSLRAASCRAPGSPQAHRTASRFVVLICPYPPSTWIRRHCLRRGASDSLVCNRARRVVLLLEQRPGSPCRLVADQIVGGHTVVVRLGEREQRRRCRRTRSCSRSHRAGRREVNPSSSRFIASTTR